MKRNWVVFAVCAALLLVGGAATARAQSEQIIFSGTGTGSFGDFGFWIWCQDENPSSDNPNSHQDYAGECAGAMYFYDLHITKGVEGDVDELSEGVYQMTVASRKGSSVSCILTNVLADDEPSSGPTNTVTVTCAAPSGDGTSTNAVVQVTGPPEH
jgi:hypothetical protein